MKNIALLIVFSFLLALVPAVPVHSALPASHPQQGTPRLYITGTQVTPNAILIKYDITYAGFVELHLFDQQGEKVWIKGNVVDKVGEHVFPISRKPLKAGQRYSYILKYKGREYTGSFYAEA